MFTIRNEQMAAMVDGSVREFKAGMVAHLRECFPEEFEELREAGAREWIRHGIDRAEVYGLLTEYEVCLYIDLMVLFGRDFDLDPELPWAAEILGNTSLLPAERIECVYDEALEHLDREAEGNGQETTEEMGEE